MVKGLLNLKTCPKKREGEFERTEIVLIAWGTFGDRTLAAVVQRSQVAFIREIWLPVWETGRLVLETPGYLGELACIYIVSRFPV